MKRRALALAIQKLTELLETELDPEIRRALVKALKDMKRMKRSNSIDRDVADRVVSEVSKALFDLYLKKDRH